MNKTMYRAAGILAVLILMGAGCTASQKAAQKTEVETQVETGQPQTSAEVSTETSGTFEVSPVVPPPTPQPVPPPPTPPPAPAPKPETTKCSSMDCLIGLARLCAKGEFTYNYSMPFPFNPEATIKGATYYKINGKDASGACVVIFQARPGTTVTISQEGRARMMANGLTEAEINAQLEAINGSFNSDEVVKSVTTCTGTGVNIASYLAMAKAGSGGSSCTINFGQKETRCTIEPNLSCIIRMP